METGGVVAETDHHVDREGTGHALLVQRMTRRNPKRSLQGMENKVFSFLLLSLLD